MDEVIVEMQRNGAYMKVTAIDTATGVEASIVGSASAPSAQLQQAAARKLRYVLENRKGQARPERGLLV